MSANNAESSWRYPGWRVAGASAAGVFASFASLLVFTFGVFLKPIAAEFGWSREQVSIGFAVAALSVAVASPFIGILLDRYGARRIILPCFAVFGLAFASLALLPGRLAVLYATFLVLGIVGNGTAQLAHARAVASWFVQRRGTAMAVMMAGSAVGAMLWPPIAQGLIDAAGWRRAVACLGAAALVIGIASAASVRDKPGSLGSVGRRSAHAASGRSALLSRPFLIIVAILFLASIGQNGAVIHLSAMLTDRGVPGEGAALAMSAMGAASILGRLAAGQLLDRFFGPRVAMGLLMVAAAGAFVLSGASSTPAGVLGAALVGFGMGGEADVTPYLLSRYFGLGSMSMLYGLTWTAYAIAGAAGPVLMGRAFDMTGSYAAFLVAVSGLMVVAAALTVAFPPYSHASRQHSIGAVAAAD